MKNNAYVQESIMTLKNYNSLRKAVDKEVLPLTEMLHPPPTPLPPPTHTPTHPTPLPPLLSMGVDELVSIMCLQCSAKVKVTRLYGFCYAKMEKIIVSEQWTVPQLSIMIIYNSAWQVLIQWIWDILSGGNLT